MKATPSDINKISRLCESNQEKQVRKMVRQFPDVAKNIQLVSAAIKGNADDVLRFLFASGADIAESGNLLLNEASVADLPVLNLCLSEMESRYEQKPEVLYAKGCAMLTYAAARAKVPQLKLLLDKGYGSISADHLRQPLLDASKKGALEVVNILLENQAKAEDVHFNAAAEHGHLSIMLALKAKNPNLVADRQSTKVVTDKREAAIGTAQFEHWAEIADLCAPPAKKHRL